MGMSYWNEGKCMLSSKDCLKSINFAPGQKLSSGILQMPGVITQLSPTDQWPSPEAPALQISVMRPLQMASSPGMICLPDLLSSFNVTRIHPRASIEALLLQRSAITSFDHVAIVILIHSDESAVTSNMNWYTYGGGWIASGTGHITPIK